MFALIAALKKTLIRFGYNRSIYFFGLMQLFTNNSFDNCKCHELLDFARLGPHRPHPLQVRRWTTATKRTTPTSARTPTTNDRHDAEEEEEKRDECSVKPTDRLFGTRPISSFGAFAPWTRTRGRPLSPISYARLCPGPGENETSGILREKNRAARRFFESMTDPEGLAVPCKSAAKKRNWPGKMFREVVQDSSW